MTPELTAAVERVKQGATFWRDIHQDKGDGVLFMVELADVELILAALSRYTSPEMEAMVDVAVDLHRAMLPKNNHNHISKMAASDYVYTAAEALGRALGEPK